MSLKIIANLLLLLSVIACGKDVYNDLKEFGYKGKVKEIELNIVRYTNNGETISSRRTSFMRFDKKGNMFYNKSNYVTLTPEEKADTTINKIYYKNGRKETFEKFSENTKEYYQKGTYIWVNKYHYKEAILDIKNKGFKFELDIQLRKDFRVKQYTALFYEESKKAPDTMGIDTFIYDKKGEILGVKSMNPEKNEIYTRHYKIYERDAKGNAIKYELFNDKTNQKVSTSTVKFTYF